METTADIIAHIIQGDIDYTDPLVEIYDYDNYNTDGFNHNSCNSVLESDGKFDKERWERVSPTEAGLNALGVDLACRVKREIPDVSFVRLITNSDRRLWLAMPDCPYTVGSIGYGHWGGSPDNTFNIWSPFIKNRRYNEGDHMYFNKQSKNLDMVIREARRCVRSIYPHELVYMPRLRNVYYDMDAAKDASNKEVSKFAEKLKAKFCRIKFINDMLNTINAPEVDSGGQLILPDEEVSTLLQEFSKAREDIASNEHNVNMLQVYLQDDRYTLTAVIRPPSDGRFSETAKLVTFQQGLIKDMPESIAAKIATLDFMNKEGLGGYNDSHWIVDTGLMLLRGRLYYVAT
jgi:hypothetical protein